jgi:hypothetical protein
MRVRGLRRDERGERRDEKRGEDATTKLVIPAEAGIQCPFLMVTGKDTGFRLPPE